jgi:hypothetical protein
VKKFVIERLDGDQWVPMLQGDSIGGRFNPFHQTFPPVKTQSVRLHILEATEAPAVAEITFE